ncbi:unnamed protein product, partial [Onchocerca flexuosa]|uniref:Helicase ATP-binding domain-containing protein n=1 Tax=Onchocerca flexuosa TaxID=387005 RepID=A0A183HR65_9BILA
TKISQHNKQRNIGKTCRCLGEFKIFRRSSSYYLYEILFFYRIDIDGLEVYFPYDYIYPEQILYMGEVKKTLDAKGHCLLEMPSGTGKTVSLLSLVVAYMLRFPDHLDKLVYCSRTIPEIEKCVEELRNLFKYYEQCDGVSFACLSEAETYGKKGLGPKQPSLFAVALSARKNLCINESVSSLRQGSLVDGACQKLTASFMRAKRRLHPDLPCCTFFEKLDEQKDMSYPDGVYNLVCL